jgi:hypothetical protein
MLQTGKYTDEGETVPVKFVLTGGKAGQALPMSAEPVPSLKTDRDEIYAIVIRL